MTQEWKRNGQLEWNGECPYCKSDMVQYDEDYIAGEEEFWGCNACHKSFVVRITIIRLEARKEEDA